MAGKFELNKGKTGKFSFKLKAGNGQLLFTSQFYDSKRSATAGINSVKKNAARESAYERKSSTRKQAYFVIKGAKAQVIGKSRMYANPASMDNGIQSVMKNAPDAPTLDLTLEAPKTKAPKVKTTPKVKTAPKVKATPKAKTAPKAKATPKAKTAPKAKATPKAQATPKAKTAPKTKAAADKKASAKKAAAPKAPAKAKTAARKNA